MTGDVVVAVLHVAVVAAGAPLLVGVLRTLKARLVGRRGPVPWQPYRDLRKLFGKTPVVSTTTSWLFTVTPYVLMSTMITAALAAPVLSSRPPLAFAGIILLMYLLLLGTFFLTLAGLDAGSAFGGMGSSRAVAVAALAEPTVILAVLALSLRANTTNLGGVVEGLAHEPLLAANPVHLLAFFAFFIVMLAEAGRIPVDNPATHLELTMIHEAMVLEYSGRYLALIEWAAALKLLVFFSLLGNLFVPWGVAVALTPGALLLAAASLVVKFLALAVIVAVLETRVAKLRLFRVPELLSASFVLALLAVTSSFLGR
jgi:formate hydrogenlyase subunit 4